MIIVISQHHSPPALCNPTPTDKILSATKALPTTAATADKRRRSLLQDVCHGRPLALEISTFTWEVYLKFEMSYIVAKD